MFRRGFNLMLRSATPLATRTFPVPTATIFQRTVTTLIGGHEESRGVRYIVPAASRRVSPETAKRHDILRAFFDSEPEGANLLYHLYDCLITFARSADLVFGNMVLDEPGGVDDGFPFKIVRVSRKERSVVYTRNYKGESIVVHFYELKNDDDKLEESDDQVENDDDELESDDDELENSKWCGRKLSMYVVKPNGWRLEFGSRTFKGESTVDDLTLKNKESGEELVYDYNDLDRNMKAAYMKFQRVRGLTNPAAVGAVYSIFD